MSCYAQTNTVSALAIMRVKSGVRWAYDAYEHSKSYCATLTSLVWSKNSILLKLAKWQYVYMLRKPFP